ncbi:MAG: N-acetylmuramoyl-L-alanine amidase, partial [Pseudomonadota bacterium]
PMMTREGDTFLPLQSRVDMARKAGGALLVSIHADSVRQGYVRGATVYTLSEGASDELAAAMAERENRSDVLAGIVLNDESDDVADILFDLARREARNLSVKFARDLVNDMDSEVRLNKKPWRRAAFSVLRAPDVPSVLLELGYLSNRTDEKLMLSKDWREKSADVVAESIEAFATQTSPLGN